MTRTLLALALLTTSLAACEVNHMPMFAPQITTARMEATVSGDIEVEVLEPVFLAADGTEIIVTDPTQDLMVDRFVSRMARHIHDDEIGRASVTVFESEAAARLGWAVDPNLGWHDARFVVDVGDLEVTIDDWGWPTLAIQLEVEGWFSASGELIYREYSSYEFPLLYADELVEPWNPNDIDDVAGTRATNLLMLDGMPDAELRARVYLAIEDAAADAARDLQAATHGG